jgi:hypothetical protein
MPLGRRLATLMLASALMISLPACEDDSALEHAGEKVDKGLDNTGAAAEEAGDSVEGAVDGN